MVAPLPSFKSSSPKIKSPLSMVMAWLKTEKVPEDPSAMPSFVKGILTIGLSLWVAAMLCNKWSEREDAVWQS